ncbi:MAG: hypothetical protein GC179_26230 [Anaerolineaceae bacterium]|nr:hypothetical protein [Anaerolineaceae bacterium]
MKRSHLLPVSLSVLALVLVLVVMAVPVAAQRPGRATPAATLDRSGSSGKRTPIATPNAAQSTRQRPTLSATFNVPLNLTLTPHGTLAVPVSSEEAKTVMNSFASTYLGASYDYVYAGTLDGSGGSANWDAFVASLPADVQAYISAFTSAAGGSYWGLFKNGLAMTAIGDCSNNPNCTISMDDLNVYLTSASSGVYSVYVAGTVNNANDALSLIYHTYPGLNAAGLQSVTTTQGYAFQAVDYGTGISNKQVTASAKIEVAGVVTVGTQSLVYAVVGVGDGYVGMIQ